VVVLATRTWEKDQRMSWVVIVSLQLWLLNKLNLHGLFTVVNHGTINDIRANSTLVVLHFLSQ
jgi:hypothetical protein